MHPRAKLELFVIESGEIVASRELDGVVILKIGLQDNFARRIAAPGASRDLC